MSTYFKCYIPPAIDESNAESVTREEEIQRRIVTRKQKTLPGRSSPPPKQRQRVRETRFSTNIECIPPHMTSLTVDEGGDMGKTPYEQVRATSLTITTNVVEGSNLRSGKEGVDLSSSVHSDDRVNLQERETNDNQQMKQLVQTITLDDLNPHGLYPNPDIPLSPQDITVLYDSGDNR